MNKIIHCVGIVCLKGDEVLLIKRGTAPRKGDWSIPGGRIELGESEAEAALRELFEETSIRARLGPKLAAIPATFEGTEYLLHDYVATWESGDPAAGDDADEAHFVAISTIKSLGMWAKTEAIIEQGVQTILGEKKTVISG